MVLLWCERQIGPLREQPGRKQQSATAIVAPTWEKPKCSPLFLSHTRFRAIHQTEPTTVEARRQAPNFPLAVLRHTHCRKELIDRQTSHENEGVYLSLNVWKTKVFLRVNDHTPFPRIQPYRLSLPSLRLSRGRKKGEKKKNVREKGGSRNRIHHPTQTSSDPCPLAGPQVSRVGGKGRLVVG